jgi:hypothetical protein
MTHRKTRKLVCIVTGRTLIATKDYYNRKVKKAGSEDHLHDSYVCKEAKNLLLKGYTVDKIRNMLNVDQTNLQDITVDVINEVLSTGKGKTRFKKINTIMSTSSILNSKTDPEVAAFLKSLSESDNV